MLLNISILSFLRHHAQGFQPLSWVRVVEVAGSQNCHWLFICSPHNSTFHAAHCGGQEGSGAIKAPFHFSSRRWPQIRPPSLQGCAPSQLNCVSCYSYFCLMASLCSLYFWPCLLACCNKMRGVFMLSSETIKALYLNQSIIQVLSLKKRDFAKQSR